MRCTSYFLLFLLTAITAMTTVTMATSITTATIPMATPAAGAADGPDEDEPITSRVKATDAVGEELASGVVIVFVPTSGRSVTDVLTLLALEEPAADFSKEELGDNLLDTSVVDAAI